MRFENIFGLWALTLGILKLWQWLEYQMYGEVQKRSVDTIVMFLWLAFVLIAYWKGRSDGHNDKEDKQ